MPSVYVRTDSALNIINKALTACGLATVADPFSSSDGAVKQMVAICTDCIRELALRYPWSQFTRDGTFTTAATDEYDLPVDFDYMVNQTHWVQTDSLPAGGPLNAQMYQLMRSTNFATNFYVYLRQKQDKIFTWPNPPPTGKVVNYEYQSRNFVLNGTSYKDYVDNSSDQILYDPLLITRFVVLRAKEARGFDTTAAEKQFEAIYDARAGKSAMAPVLSLTGHASVPLISIDNVPESSFG